MSFIDGFLIGTNARKNGQISGYRDEIASLERALESTIKAGRSQVHVMRAREQAHYQIENMLRDEIGKLYQNNPLADKEKVTGIFAEKTLEWLRNDELVRRTYPNGIIPADTLSADGEDYMRIF